MKAGIFAAALALVMVTAGCGGGTSSTTGSGGGGNSSVYVLGPTTNSVLGYSQNSSGALIPFKTAPTTNTGSIPVSMVLHPSLKLAFIANNADGTITIRVRDTSTGILTKAPLPPNVLNPPPDVLAGTNPIAMAMTPSGNFVYVLNQGSSDISAFSVDLTNNTIIHIANNGNPTFPTPADPRFIAVSSDGRLLYVSNPTTSTIYGFSIGTDGKLTPVAGSPFATGTVACAALPAPCATFLLVDPQTTFLYVTDPLGNKVRVFSIAGSGVLSQTSGSPFATGSTPSSLAINSSGNFLLVTNQASNSVSGFSVAGGSLSAVAGSPFNTGVGPSFVIFDKANSFVYIADQGSNDVAAYQLTGTQLRSLVGAPFSVGTSPTWIVTSP